MQDWHKKEPSPFLRQDLRAGIGRYHAYPANNPDRRSQDNDNRPGDHQKRAEQHPGGHCFAQEEHRQEYGDGDTRFIDGSDIGHFPGLERPEIEYPRKPGRKTRKAQKRRLFFESAETFAPPFFTSTIPQATNNITTVLTAVARSASIPLTPTLASTAVNAANNADNSAYTHHMPVPPFPANAKKKGVLSYQL